MGLKLVCVKIPGKLVELMDRSLAYLGLENRSELIRVAIISYLRINQYLLPPEIRGEIKTIDLREVIYNA